VNRKHRLFLLIFLAIAIVSHAMNLVAAELVWPDSRVATIARGYIETFNSNDAAQMEAFAAEYRTEAALAKRPPAERAQRRLGMYQQVGPMVPVLITDETATSLSVTCRMDKVNMWMKLNVKLEAEEPYKLDVVEMMPTSPPDMTAADTSETAEWTDLASLLEEVRERHSIPGLAAAIVEDGRVMDIAVIGVRVVNTADAVKEADAWHIGSITKSMTATMVGALVESGKLDWDITVGEALDGTAMRDEYRDVTLQQLLDHRGGVQSYTIIDAEEEKRLARLTGSATEQRAMFVEQVLSEEPVGTIGNFEYSNAGYSVAAFMAERATGQSWESLMNEHVFKPAGMIHAGFGWAATPESPNQPWGHFGESGAYRTQAFGEYDLGPYLAPAGDVHASIAGMAAYAQLHLDGLNGKDGSIRAETVRHLHTASSDGAGPAYTCGWMIRTDGAAPVHEHAGSAGTLFAHIELHPDTGRAIVITMNVGMEGMGISQEISQRINERWKSAP